MTDQAAPLRKLIENAEPAAKAEVADSPMVVVTGAMAGVGATTVAVNLAAAMADRGERVVVVDADEQRNNLVDVAGARKRGEEDGKLVDGPVGVRVLATRRRVSPKLATGLSPRRVIDGRKPSTVVQLMDSVRDETDLFVVDTGSGLTPATRRLWSRASLVLLVTTPEDASLLDAYAVLKQCSNDAVGADVRLLVNQACSDSEADGVRRRITGAAERFLSRKIDSMPSVPHDVFDSDAVSKWPRVWERPNTPFGHAMLWLGREIGGRMRDAGYGGQGQGSSDSAASRFPHSASL